ncbi:hypothetical protein BKA00_003308 [Actinomadura coerulea]|uniref:DUF11 domain-containing protein n=1 Tax=Actinomadura coerulea TaxID=46159 RepID=A0A7X0KZP8_9ACTN|nr:hypothetical protein [Actinomadura coerulea]MBB6396394.1 hypothetical protein [Actinomadura coerulea]
MALAIAAPLLGGVLLPAAAQADGPDPKPKPRQHGKQAAGVALRTDGPASAVVPGRIYEWTFKMTAKGPGESGKAVFRTTLPRSLAFVSGTRGCAAAGWTVECDLGAVRKGRTVTGAIKTKVSGDARPGQTIRLHGTVTWGRAHTERTFPAVRVVRSAHLGHAPSKAAPKNPGGKKPEAKEPVEKKPVEKKPAVKKPAVRKPAAVRRVALSR